MPFLKEQTEMLYLFIKDYHSVNSQPYSNFEGYYITESINEWVEQIWKKYQVNLIAFTFNWANYFYDNPDIWPAKYKKKNVNSSSKFIWYDYDYKQKSNLFNIDSLYRKLPKKAFIKGRKQELEVLMMYHWLNSICGDDEGYWHTYLQIITNELEKNEK